MNKLFQLAGLALAAAILLVACAEERQLPEPTALENGPPPTGLHKTIAVLCMIANVNYNLIAPSEATLNRNTLKINEALKNNAGLRAYVGNDWQVVWGPATSNSQKAGVSVPDSFVTDNTMYVARGINPAT